MKSKNLFLLSSIVLIFTLIAMGIHLFLIPLTDSVVRIIGIIMIIDLCIMVYNGVKLKQSTN